MAKKEPTAKETKTVATIETPSKGELQVSEYKALNVNPEQLALSLKHNAGPQGLTPFDLDRIKIPSGGGTMWEVPTLEGPQNFDRISGIVLHFKDVRAFWAEKYGGANNPPDCASMDGIFGIGKPGGNCAKCPFAQFGSAVDDKGKPGRGQACKQARMLFLLRPSDYLPIICTLPPTSLKPAKQYFLRLASNGLMYYSLITDIGLAKEKNSGGIPYSQARFRPGRKLNEEESRRVSIVAEAMRSIFDKATIIEGDVRGSDE